MGDYKVIVSRRADRMLIDHARFLAQVSPTAARRLAAEFSALLDALEDNPLRFPFEEDYDLPRGVYRKAIFGKRYKALFSVQDHAVYLDAVLDGRQDNAKHFS